MTLTANGTSMKRQDWLKKCRWTETEFDNVDEQHSKVLEFETNQLDRKLLLPPPLPPSALNLMTRPFETWPIAIFGIFTLPLAKIAWVVLLQPINRTASARSGRAADPSSLELSPLPPSAHTHAHRGSSGATKQSEGVTPSSGRSRTMRNK